MYGCTFFLRNRSFLRLQLLLAILVLILSNFAGLQPTSAAEINPGLLQGDISFTNTSSDVRNYLTSNSVVPSSEPIPELWPVRLYTPQDMKKAATAFYTPSNSVVDTQTYRAASYGVSPNVPSSGANFVVEVDSIQFSDGAWYRFGSLESQSPSFHLSSTVVPVAVAPGGTILNINDCATLITLSIHFTGQPADLNALADEPVQCIIEAFVEDVPGSSRYNWQARSGMKTFAVDSLKSSQGVLMPILIRAQGNRAKLAVSCTARVKSNETGFVVIPASGLTPFGTEVSLGPFACGDQPAGPIDVGVPVERTAGKLRGLFDVSGHMELATEIEVDNDYRLRVSPSPVLPGAIPTVPWEFAGILAGQRKVKGRALIAGGNQILEFPHRDGFNTPVNIIRNSVTDIGSTFVSRPSNVTGHIVLTDPGGNTDLRGLQNAPFQGLYDNNAKSNIQAMGEYSLPETVGPLCWDRSSGLGGESYGRLVGAYNPAEKKAELDYNLLISGLSPEGGNPNGSNTCPAIWRIHGLNLAMTTETETGAAGYCSSRIRFGQNFLRTAELDISGQPRSYTLRDQTFCFGKLGIRFQVANPAIGTIYGPGLNISQADQGVVNNTFGTIYSFDYGWASGTPQSASQSGSTAFVAITLPEGLRYRIWPYLYFKRANDPSPYGTYMFLDSMALPDIGYLGCGEIVNPCISLDEEGNYSLLNITFPDYNDYCLLTNSLNLPFTINSGGIDIAKVGYLLDPANQNADLSDPSAVILCSSNCGPSPQYTVNLTNITSSAHTLRIIAIADNGCKARRDYAFSIASQPLNLQCPPDFTVTLDSGETEVAASDTRISDNLQATVTGGCGLPVTIQDDRPESFTPGETDVNFWIQGGTTLSCSTKVTVKEPKEHLVAYTVKQDGGQGLRLYKVETGQLFWERIVENPTWIEFNPDGSRIGVCQRVGENGRVDIYNVETAERLISTQTNGIPSNMAFNPQNTSLYAVVCSKLYQTYEVSLFREGNLIQANVLPQPPHMSKPEIAWSPDGNHVAVLFTRPIFTSSGQYAFKYRIHILQWKLTQSGLAPEGSIEVEKSSPVREEERELLFDKNNRLHFSSNKGISFVGSDGTIRLVAEIENDDIDMCDDHMAAVIAKGDRVGFVTNIGPGLTPQIRGRILGEDVKKLQVAITNDEKYIAVQKDNGVVIYKGDDFSLVHSFSANRPMFTTFQPTQ